MPGKLVTLATFGSPIEAGIVRNQLDAEGIHAWLADKGAAGIGLGGGRAIKLQVFEEDVVRAVAVIEANAPTADDVAPGQADDRGEADGDDAEEDQAASAMDAVVVRAFRAAVLGLFCCPLQLYSYWLLARIMLHPDPLGPRNRWVVGVTALINVPHFVLWTWVIRFLLRALTTE